MATFFYYQIKSMESSIQVIWDVQLHIRRCKTLWPFREEKKTLPLSARPPRHTLRPGSTQAAPRGTEHMCAPMPSSPKLQLNPQIQSYIGAHGDLSHADLMWSLFLLGHQNLSGICNLLVVKNGDQWQWDWTHVTMRLPHWCGLWQRLAHQKPMPYNEIGLCAQYMSITLSSTVHTIGRGLCDHLKRVFNLNSYKFSISTPILELETSIFVIHRNG